MLIQHIIHVELIPLCILNSMKILMRFCRCRCVIFSKSTFRKIISGILSEYNSLDSDQARRSVGTDLGPNCLQKRSSDDTRSRRLKALGS